MTEMTEQAVKLDYSTWTYADHLAMTDKLAAEADTMAAADVSPSVAAVRREGIRQTTARGWLHAKLAELKRPDTAVPATLVDTDTATAVPSAKPTATAKARARQAGDGVV
jgi:hypothetical protein